MYELTRRKFLTNAWLAAGAIGISAISGRHLLGMEASAPVIAKTPSGALRGEALNGVRIFRGVPFAEPPVGPLRFLPTVPLKPWKGERDATQFGKAPVQNPHPAGMAPVPLAIQSEDCLYLNVWAPEGAGPFPVFVWIHGGGFTAGHAFEPVYDGTEFAREGIVCITVAYRLGVFGFLDFGPLLGQQYAGTANNALCDLVAALSWIQNNVAALGGDPERVTIGGESAGAKLTDILMGVPAAEKLFHQMISESGGAERIWQHGGGAAVARGFANDWQEDTGGDAASLKTADGQALIKTQQRLMATWPQHFPLRAEVDGKLVPRLPVQTIAAGSTRGKRLLIGTNREESALFLGPAPAEDPTANDLGNVDLEAFDKVFARYKELYPHLTPEQLRIRAVTAEEYWLPSVRVAEAHVQGGGSAFVYELEFKETSGRMAGNAYHSLDVGMVWNHPHKLVENAAAEAALGKQMHTAWAAFIRGETPAAAGLPAWPEYDLKRRATMILGVDGGAQSVVERGPQEAELQLWEGVL